MSTNVLDLCAAIFAAHGVGASCPQGLEKFATVDEAFPTLEYLTGTVDDTGSAIRTKTAPITLQQAKNALAAYTAPDAADVSTFNRELKAVAIWTAQKLGIPLAQVRSEIITIYRNLQ